MVDVVVHAEALVKREILVRRLANLPLWIVGALVALHAGALALDHLLGVTGQQPWRFIHYQFHLDRELNVSTWVASMLLALAGALLLVIALEAHLAGRRWRNHWAALGVIFLVLSLDEMCSFHERLSEPVQEILGIGGGVLTNAWVLVILPVVVAVLVPFVPFLWALPPSTRWQFMTAGAIFVSGAAGVELISGLTRDRFGFDDTRFVAATTVEEVLELLGVAVFLRAVSNFMFGAGTLSHLARGSGSSSTTA